MDKIENGITIITSIASIISIISSNFTGILYDDKRKKLDKTYNGNHSFYSNNSRFRFSLPFPIVNKDFKNELKNITYKYNLAAYTFWICLCVLLYIQFCK